MSSITTHVLDTARGRPAQGVFVVLEQRVEGDTWLKVGEGQTDADGRLRSLTNGSASHSPGIYRLVFETQRYFQSQRTATFYPRVVIEFETTESEAHYHVPLLISPFGYSTYRGS